MFVSQIFNGFLPEGITQKLRVGEISSGVLKYEHPNGNL